MRIRGQIYGDHLYVQARIIELELTSVYMFKLGKIPIPSELVSLALEGRLL